MKPITWWQVSLILLLLTFVLMAFFWARRDDAAMFVVALCSAALGTAGHYRYWRCPHCRQILSRNARWHSCCTHCGKNLDWQ